MSSSTTLLQVFFSLPIGLQPSTSSSIALLSMLFSFLCFTWHNHLNVIFLNLCSRFSTPHHLLTSSLLLLSCHLTLDIYLNILWSQLASSSSSLSVPKFPQHTEMHASYTHSTPLLFPRVECYCLLASKLANLLHLLWTHYILSYQEVW